MTSWKNILDAIIKLEAHVSRMAENGANPQINSRRRPRNGSKNKDPDKMGDKRPQQGNKSLFRVSEVLKVIKEFPVSQINGREFDPKHTRSMTAFVRNTLLEEDIYMVLKIVPSDPDFPFDLTGLEVALSVPKNYPMKKNKDNTPFNRPTITVLNTDIPRGISINIERGFNQIVAKTCQKKGKKSKSESPEELDIKVVGGNNLYGCVKTLDVYLAVFLAQRKRDTIKIVKRMPRSESKTKEDICHEDTVIPDTLSKFKASHINVSREEIQALNKSIELVSYRMKKENKKFTLSQNHRNLGYEYKFVLDAKPVNLPDDFKISNMANILALDPIVLRLLIPLDIQNEGLKILSFDVAGKNVLSAEIDHKEPVKLDQPTEAVLVQFLSNVKYTFNKNSKALFDKGFTLFSLLNYLEVSLLQLGLGDDYL